MSLASTTTKPVTSGMLCEWARNPAACGRACADALPTFSLDVVSVVVGYLQKTEGMRIYGVKEIEAAYGKWELMLAAGGPVQEVPMPLEFEALLQMNLSDVFSPKDCAFWKGKTKIYEVFSVYFKPPNLSPLKTEQLAQRCGAQLAMVGIDCRSYSFGQVIAQNGIYLTDPVNDSWAWLPPNFIDPHASWLLFPDEPLPVKEGAHVDIPVSRAEFQARKARLPRDAQVPRFGDASYCILTRFACTKERIYALKPSRRTCTLEEIDIGFFQDQGLYFMPTWTDRRRVTRFTGFSPTWKVSLTPPTKFA